MIPKLSVSCRVFYISASRRPLHIPFKIASPFSTRAISSQFLRHESTVNSPPSYFSDPNNIPPPLQNKTITDTHHLQFNNKSMKPTSAPSSSSSSSSSRLASVRDLSIVISIFTLAYFAVDNYRVRIAMESKLLEQSMNHMKSLAITQNNFNNARKKRELDVLNERKNTQKREMKMVYHISLLRKQLIDAGIKPVDIDAAIAEFEKNVKMENSISNISGQALWVVDESPMKGYVPNTHDYESKK